MAVGPYSTQGTFAEGAGRNRVSAAERAAAAKKAASAARRRARKRAGMTAAEKRRETAAFNARQGKKVARQKRRV